MNLERKITFGFVVGALVLLLVGSGAWWNARRLKTSHLLVEHTHEVLNRLERVLTNVLSMQTSTRGFVITGTDAVLEPYERNRVELAQDLPELRQLIGDNPAQLKRLEEVETWTSTASAIMAERIAARQARGLASAQDTQRFLEGQHAVETVRDRIQVMKDEERRLLDGRLSASEAAGASHLTTIVIAAALAAAMVLAAAAVTRREFRLRRQTEAALRHLNGELEARVRERTLALENANRDLQQQVAERQRAELAIRESETRLKEAQAQAKLGHWERNLVTGTGTWSEELFHLHARDPQLGVPSTAEFLQLVHPEDRAALVEAHDDSKQTEAPIVHEYRIVRGDGQVRWILGRTQGFRDEHGTLVRRSGTAQDITDRIAAEEAVRNSERRFRALIEHSADGISLIDEKMKVVYISPAVTSIEGYFPTELDRRSSRENTHPDDLPMIHETIARILNSPGKPIPVLWRRRHRDGHWMWLEGVSTNLLADPAVRAIVTNYRDVTERKRIEEIRARLVAIVESSEDAILSKALDGTITSWNRGAEKIFGYAPEEAVGKSIFLLIPEERQREETAILERLQRGESVSHFETIRRTRDGRLINVSVSISLIKDSDGRIIGASKIARDITAHKAAQEEIRRLNQELEQRVVQRTSQLQAANRELEAFSYSVSHDLRAPLRHVDGFAGLLEKHAGAALDEKSRRYLSTISNAARQMGRLIDDLLSFSRMARSPMAAQQVDHDALVADVIRENDFQSGHPTIEWSIGELPPVHADRAMLRLVWANLLDNAVKYSGKNPHPRIEIGSLPPTEKSADTPGSGQITFFIRDNGVGFDMAYVDKLFGVFQRLHGPAEFEGTGIGLANVRRIITRHGGRTWAEGQVGRGATFYFSLPITVSAPSSTI